MAKQTPDKAPPHDLDAEMATLGAMMIDRQAANHGLAVVSENDFWPIVHRVIFRAIKTVADAGDPVDLVTVSRQLRSMGKLEDVGSGDYLTALIGKPPTAAHVRRYAGIVRELSLKRFAIRWASEVAEKGYNDAQLDELLDKMNEGMLTISAARDDRRGTQSFQQIFESFVGWHDKEMEKDWSVEGARFGIPSIDRTLGGLGEQTVVVIRAFTGYGKSSILRQSILETAKKAGPVLVYVLEGNPMLWLRACVSWLARVDYKKCGRGGYKRQTDTETQRIMDAWKELPNLPIWFGSDVRGLSELRADIMLRTQQLDTRPVAVYIDYLQLVEAPQADGQTEALNLALKAATSLNEQLRIPIITASQITVTQGGRHATRWSKEAENAPSLIFEIERGRSGSKVSKNPDVARWKPEIRLLPVKQRIGDRLSTTELKARWEYSRFYDEASEYDDKTPDEVRF